MSDAYDLNKLRDLMTAAKPVPRRCRQCAERYHEGIRAGRLLEADRQRRERHALATRHFWVTLWAVAATLLLLRGGLGW